MNNILTVSEAIEAINNFQIGMAIDANKRRNDAFLANKKKFDELFEGYDYDGDYIRFDELLDINGGKENSDTPTYKKVAYGLALLYVMSKYIIGETIDSAKKKHKSAFQG